LEISLQKVYINDYGISLECPSPLILSVIQEPPSKKPPSNEDGF
jgi:hypothetical protein